MEGEKIDESIELESNKENNIFNNEKFNLTVISVITLASLVVTHPFSSYIFSAFLLLMYVAYRLKNRLNTDIDIMRPRYILRYIVLLLLFIFTWTMYYAKPTIEYFSHMVNFSFLSILSFAHEHMVQRVPFRLTTLPEYELIIDKYFFIPILLLLFTYCLYSMRKNREYDYIPLILYGSIFFLTLPLIFTMAGKLFMYRSWPFAFIGLSFSMANVYIKLIEKRCTIKNVAIKNLVIIPIFISIALIIIGGVSIDSSSSYRDPNYLDASIPSSITTDEISASHWFRSNAGEGNVILGDTTAYIVFGGDRQFVEGDHFLYYKPTMDPESIFYLYERFGGSYVVVDNRITEKLSGVRYYFNDGELDLKDPWGYMKTFPKENLAKFDSYIGLYRIYDNGNVNIYNVGMIL